MTAMLYARYALSWVIGCLPIEVTGQLSVVNGLDVEKAIEVDYDRWVRPASRHIQLTHSVSCLYHVPNHKPLWALDALPCL
jgi:hypothetical protein